MVSLENREGIKKKDAKVADLLICSSLGKENKLWSDK